MSFVTDELRPSFSSVRVTSTCEPSTTNADTPLAVRVPGSVRANRSSGPPNAAFVIHCFVPRMCQPPSVSSADVTSEPASDPAPGSVSAKQPIVSPRASGGTNCATCVVGSEREDRQRARARVHRDGDADACVCARELLEHEDVRQEVGAGATVLLRHADAEQAQLRELVEQLAREAVGAIPLGRVWLDLGGGDLARDRLDLALLRRELEVHARQTTPMRRVAILAVIVALTACGGHSARSAEDVARAWSAALNKRRRRGGGEAVRAVGRDRPERRARAADASTTRSSGTRHCRAAAASPASCSRGRTRCSSCST